VAVRVTALSIGVQGDSVRSHGVAEKRWGPRLIVPRSNRAVVQDVVSAGPAGARFVWETRSRELKVRRSGGQVSCRRVYRKGRPKDRGWFVDPGR